MKRMKKAAAVMFCLLVVLGLSACGGTTVKAADLGEVMADIEAKVPMENMMSLPESTLMSEFGIDSADVKQYAAKVNDTGIKADAIVMVEGTSLDAANRVKDKMDAYLLRRSNQFNNYIPEEYAVIQNCKVQTFGNYVVLFVSKEADKMTDIFKSYTT